jgi:hypothetical protein
MVVVAVEAQAEQTEQMQLLVEVAQEDCMAVEDQLQPTVLALVRLVQFVLSGPAMIANTLQPV